MRLVSWNCCDDFRSKFGHLERLKPDIAVVQEIRADCLRYAAVQDRSVWVPEIGHKGLAVIAYGDWKLSRAAPNIAEQWFLPLRATNGAKTINLVGVWLNPPKGVTQDYVSPTLSALEQLHSFISEGQCVIAGDFNMTAKVDHRFGTGRRFADVRKILESHSLKSAWHFKHNEDYGQESKPTLYWQWNEKQQFHIDFAFSSPNLGIDEVSLGEYQQYTQAKISDHVPLSVSYTL